jgi:hypothetical protein
MFLVRTRSPALKRAGAVAGRPNDPRVRAFGTSAAVSLRGRVAQRMAGGDLVGADEAALDRNLFEPHRTTFRNRALSDSGARDFSISARDMSIFHSRA